MHVYVWVYMYMHTSLVASGEARAAVCEDERWRGRRCTHCAAQVASVRQLCDVLTPI